MQTIDMPSLADQTRTLPPQGTARDRQIHRLIDGRAAASAAAALQTAVTHSRDAGAFSTALTAAAAVLGGAAPDDPVRDRLRDAVTSPEFLTFVPRLIRELRQTASSRGDTGACTVATAFALWSWTVNHVRGGDFPAQATDELAEAIAPLLAARCLALDAATSSGDPDELALNADLSHVNAARASAAAGAACAEIVFGYRRHMVWDAEGCATCYAADELDAMEAVMPGIASGARTSIDVLEADGSHPAKEGPCARFDGLDKFMRLRSRLDGCLTGARIAKDRAAAAITRFTEGKA